MWFHNESRAFWIQLFDLDYICFFLFLSISIGLFDHNQDNNDDDDLKHENKLTTLVLYVNIMYINMKLDMRDRNCVAKHKYSVNGKA